LRRFEFVMPGLVPGIHVLLHLVKKGVDGRDKPGHDEGAIPFPKEAAYPTTFTGGRLIATVAPNTRSKPARKASSASRIICSLSSSTGDS
jgi:hypothetical protein